MVGPSSPRYKGHEENWLFTDHGVYFYVCVFPSGRRAFKCWWVKRPCHLLFVDFHGSVIFVLSYMDKGLFAWRSFAWSHPRRTWTFWGKHKKLDCKLSQQGTLLATIVNKQKTHWYFYFWPVRQVFWRFWKKHFSIFFQKHINSDLSDTNGYRKHHFHDETIAIETGETDFRSTVTHFINFCMFFS